jgi:hypothetical protein
MPRVHWATISTDLDADSACGIVEDTLGGQFTGSGRGQFNQPISADHESGLRVFHGAEHQGQPVVVCCDGETCDRLGEAVLQGVLRATGGRLTRLDVAEDVEPASDARVRLIAMREAYKAGEVVTRKRASSWEWRESGSSDDGCTLYVGRRQAETFLRAYDRRGPLRLEWEIKPASRERGSSLTASFVRVGAGPLWRGAARSVEFGFPWYQSLLDGDAVTITGSAAEAKDLDELIHALRHTCGPAIELLHEAGYDLRALGRLPPTMGSRALAKYRRVANDLTAVGLDGRAVLERLSQCRRSN